MRVHACARRTRGKEEAPGPAAASPARFSNGADWGLGGLGGRRFSLRCSSPWFLPGLPAPHRMALPQFPPCHCVQPWDRTKGPCGGGPGGEVAFPRCVRFSLCSFRGVKARVRTRRHYAGERREGGQCHLLRAPLDESGGQRHLL